MPTPVIGGTYRHYKGNLYEVVAVGNHSETLEQMVIYEALQDSDDFKKGTLWVRSYDEFVGEVEVDGAKVPRFAYIPEAEELVS